MSDYYISREALLSATEGYNWNEGLKTVLKRIPAADVRPVVLCRDCKCYQQSHYIDNHMECTRSGVPVHSVDFCSFGEKEGEKLMIPWIYADLDTIIDSYSEPLKEEET